MKDLMALIIAIQAAMFYFFLVPEGTFKMGMRLMNRWVLLLWVVFVSSMMVALQVAPEMILTDFVLQILIFLHLSIFINILGGFLEKRLKWLDMTRISFGIGVLGILMSLFFEAMPQNAEKIGGPFFVLLSLINIAVGRLSMSRYFASGMIIPSVFQRRDSALSQEGKQWAGRLVFTAPPFQTVFEKALHGFLISILGLSFFTALAHIQLKGWIEICVVFSVIGGFSMLGALGACLGHGGIMNRRKE